MRKFFFPIALSTILIGSAFALPKIDYPNLEIQMGNKQDPVKKSQSPVFNLLPFEHSIKYVYGNGEYALAMFADKNCPVCQRWLNELERYRSFINMTLYIFPVNIFDKTGNESAWCSKDRETAFLYHQDTTEEANCNTPVAYNTFLMSSAFQDNGRSATPTFVFTNGMKNVGYFDPLELSNIFEYVKANPNATPFSEEEYQKELETLEEKFNETEKAKNGAKEQNKVDTSETTPK